MRLLSILSIAIVLSSCATVKDCGVKPTIAIEKEKNKNVTETTTDTKSTPGSIIQDIKENAVPGGQVKCTF